jgi:hypothetical protein
VSPLDPGSIPLPLADRQLPPLRGDRAPSGIKAR